jgi:hypothetical protein
MQIIDAVPDRMEETPGVPELREQVAKLHEEDMMF